MASPELAAIVSIDAQVQIPALLTEARVGSLIQSALSREDQHGEWQIACSFIDLAAMVEMHTTFMGDDSPTDILTFPFDSDMGPGGDIAICVPVASANAQEFGSDLLTELQFLILHGVLHLTGHDDATGADREAMLARQQAILDAWYAESS